MTTSDILPAWFYGPLDWRSQPAPQNGPYFVRHKGSPYHVLNGDNWLLKQVWGADYEWAPVAFPP